MVATCHLHLVGHEFESIPLARERERERVKTGKVFESLNPIKKKKQRTDGCRVKRSLKDFIIFANLSSFLLELPFLRTTLYYN